MKLIKTICTDLELIMSKDPAVKSKMEVILCYPGFHAVVLHRVSHLLYKNKFRLPARMLSNFTRFLTGVDIHPAVRLGEGVFLDHATGIVIGETCEIGNNVTIFQGVTLGANFKETGKRHPTIGNNVVIGSGAKVLGSFKVGDNSVIGAGSVVLKEVPDNSVVVGIPGRIARKAGGTNE